MAEVNAVIGQEKIGMTEKKKEKSILDNKVIVGAILIVGFCWLLAYSNLSTILFKVAAADLPAFQENMFKISLILTIIFVTALIFVFYLKDKLFEYSKKESSAIILVDSHTQIPVIETIAKMTYGLQLGRCVYISPLMPYTEAGSTPTSRFFEFENRGNGLTVSNSLWRQDYFRKITTHLMYREFNGRIKQDKFRHGEYRQESFRSITDTAASKKARDASHIQTQEDYEGAMTDEE